MVFSTEDVLNYYFFVQVKQKHELIRLNFKSC